jgi:mannose-6-phosphate isomerase-like protein (cupin superfamily)
MTSVDAMASGYGLGADEGERRSWMGEPTVLKATGNETGGRYAIAEIVSTPEGFVPLHVHHREDEAFVVLDGEVAFTIADRTFVTGPGGFAFGPRDVPHRYEVRTPSARMLMIFSPAGFEGFIRETSTPVDAIGASEAEDLDLELIADAAARYGAEMLD